MAHRRQNIGHGYTGLRNAWWSRMWEIAQDITLVRMACKKIQIVNFWDFPFNVFKSWLRPGHWNTESKAMSWRDDCITWLSATDRQSGKKNEFIYMLQVSFVLCFGKARQDSKVTMRKHYEVWITMLVVNLCPVAQM